MPAQQYILQAANIQSGGGPVANGSIKLVLSAGATIIGAGAAPASYTFNLDSSGNLPANAYVWGNNSLTPAGTFYTATLWTNANAGAPQLPWANGAMTLTWGVGGGALYSGTLYPDVIVFPAITISANQIDGVTVTGAASIGQAIVATSPSAATWQNIVSSVGLSAPAIFTVSGSPVTTSGTLTFVLANENANLIFAGPTTGSPAAPTFRGLVAADIPFTAPGNASAVSHQFLTSYNSTTGVFGQAQPAFTDISGTAALTQGGTGVNLSGSGSSTAFLAQDGSHVISARSIALGDLPTIPRIASINYVIDGGGGLPSLGVQGQLNMPVACTVTGWVLTADQVGACVVDVLRSTYAAFPTTASIAGSDKPTIVATNQKAENLSISAWGSTALVAGDQVQFSLSSVTNLNRINLTLNVTIP